MDVSIMIEGQMGLTWPRWKRIVSAVEDLGFAGLFRSDHFTNPRGPVDDSLELITSLAYAADHTSRIHFGPLVAPVSFRDPVMLTRQAAALADLSGGRMLLGMGAGWQEREHEAFGYGLAPDRERLDRLEEGLRVAVALSRAEGPATFEGRYYRLREAEIRPKVSVPILVGGNGQRRTLPLAARYADWWNGVFLNVDAFRARAKLLDELLSNEGRPAGAVRRTMMSTVFLDRDDDELRGKGALAGSAEQIKRQLADYEEAGLEEVMVQWFALDDMEGLEAFARAVL